MPTRCSAGHEACHELSRIPVAKIHLYHNAQTHLAILFVPSRSNVVVLSLQNCFLALYYRSSAHTLSQRNEITILFSLRARVCGCRRPKMARSVTETAIAIPTRASRRSKARAHLKIKEYHRIPRHSCLGRIVLRFGARIPE